MYRKICVLLGLLLLVLTSCNLSPRNNNTALPTVIVKPVLSESEFEEGLADTETWVRVDLVSRLPQDLAVGKTLNVESVTLCQVESCYTINHSKNINLSDLDESMGTPLTGAVVPSGQYTQISVELSAQSTVGLISQTVKFQEPISLQAVTETAVFLVLEPTTSDKANLHFVASGEVNSELLEPFVFEPGYTTTLTLPSGFNLELASDSLEKATVFSWYEHDTLDLSSLYDFYPEVTLKQPAKVTIPIDMTRMPQGLTLNNYQLQLSTGMTDFPVLQTLSTASVPSALSYEIPSLNTLNVQTTHPVTQVDGKSFATSPLPESTGVFTPADADVSVCARTLANNLTQNLATLNASTDATVQIKDCEGIAPFVHIVVVKLSGSGTRFGKVVFPVTQDAQGNYLLRKLSDHASSVSAIAAINGFNWAGGLGTRGSTNQKGTFLSTTYIKGKQVGIRTGAEAIIGFTKPSTTLQTLTTLFDKAANATPNLGSYNYNALGSTTSIIKNGGCSRQPNETPTSNDPVKRRWSAIGLGNGRLVMVSSVSARDSSKDTTAYELCSIFRALNANGGAIRLDGGPSAGIYYRGTFLNPLIGPNFITFGSARQILYPIAITK